MYVCFIVVSLLLISVVLCHDFFFFKSEKYALEVLIIFVFTDVVFVVSGAVMQSARQML